MQRHAEIISYVRMILKGFLGLVVMAGALYLLSGRKDYWQAGLFSIVLIAIFTAKSFLFVRKTDLIRERLRPGPGTKKWDIAFYAVYITATLAVIIAAPLDIRFSWSPALPAYIYILSFAALALSMSLFIWAEYVNSFFSSTVRLQKDRGQTVVKKGPYAFVRHPGYVGGIFLEISMALCLGSVYALAPAAIAAAALVIRTFLEDRTLSRELEGYSEYTREVRYRLFPGIW